MAEIYIPLDEAAQLEDLKYLTLYKRIERNPEAYEVKTEPSANGGKDRVLVNIASLSKKARRAYKEKINVENEVKKMIVDENASSEMPWYVDVDYQWYVENNKKEYYKAVELAKNMEEFLKYDGPGKTEFAEEYAKSLGMSSRSLFRKSKAYLEGAAWSLKMSEKDGKSYDFYKVFALCTKPKKKGKYPSLTMAEKAYIENIWFADTFAQNNGTMSMLYSAYLSKCQDEGWEPVSYPTVNRYINDLMEENSSAHFLVSQGVRKWKGTKMLKARRDTGALQVMEIVQGDSHTFDCWVLLTRENGTQSIIRPILSAFIDTRSRCFVGWGICEVPNSQVLKSILLNMIYEKQDPEVPFYGVPKYLLIDNGKDYTAESLTGRPRNVRVDFDMETKGFYRSIGIQDDIRSLPYQAWGKAQIERSFGTVCNMFTKWIDSYTGTLTGSKTIGKVKKDVKKLADEGKLMTMEEFTERFGYWLKTVYHARKHAGLKEQGEAVPVPIQVYKNGERYMQAPPPLNYAEMLLMKSEDALVRSTGIRKFNFNYLADELGAYVGKHVTVRWNPDNITKLYVYDSQGKKICEALSQELLAIGPKIAEKALEDHIKRQKRQLRQAKETIKEMQMPFEERLAAASEELAATKPIMLQDLKEDNPKVVSMPSDRQYKDSLKDKKTKEDEPVQNKFFEQQADEVFAMLENL